MGTDFRVGQFLLGIQNFNSCFGRSCIGFHAREISQYYFRMAVPGNITYMLCPVTRKYTRWYKEAVHDDGCLLGYYHVVRFPRVPIILGNTNNCIYRYLLFAAVFISVKSVMSELAQNNGNFAFSSLFSNQLFRDLLVSLCSTYILYFVASFMFFEPWHMFTSVCHHSYNTAYSIEVS